MRVITRPPHIATLLANGVATIVTQESKPDYTPGEWVAIAADDTDLMTVDHDLGPYQVIPDGRNPTGWWLRDSRVWDEQRCKHRDPDEAAFHAAKYRAQHPEWWISQLHPGHIVGSAKVEAVVPIVNWGADPQADHITIGSDGRLRAWAFVAGSQPLTWTALNPAARPSNGGPGVDDLTDQLAFASFEPGWWAVILTDAAPTTKRCPACLGEGWFVAIGERIANPRYPEDYTGGVEQYQYQQECWACQREGTCPPIPFDGGEEWQP